MAADSSATCHDRSFRRVELSATQLTSSMGAKRASIAVEHRSLSFHPALTQVSVVNETGGVLRNSEFRARRSYSPTSALDGARPSCDIIRSQGASESYAASFGPLPSFDGHPGELSALARPPPR